MKLTRLYGMRLAAALCAAALVLTACGGADSSDTDTKGEDTTSAPAPEVTKEEIYQTGWVNVSDAPAEAKDGGTLIVAEYGEPTSLDPTKTYANGAVGGNIMAAIYDTLTRYDFDTDTFVPQLAESVTTEDNGMTWTLKLREGVTFTDGTPLDADAVLASQEYYTAGYGYQFMLMLSSVEESKKIDDLTIEYQMRFPWANFPNMLAQGPGMILAPAAYADPENFEPIGAGAFMLDKHAPQEELIVKANPDYWNGKPHLDEIKFIWIGQVDDKPKVDAINDGTVDVAFLRKPEIVEEAFRDGMTGVMWATGLASNYWINTREGYPGEDVRVRKALQLAFNPEFFVENAYDGAGIPTYALVADSSPWAVDVPQPEPDPEEAAKLLEEAKADGYDGKITISHGADPSSQSQSVTLKGMLEAVGFEVDLRAHTSVADQTNEMYVDRSFDLAVSSSSVTDIDPMTAFASIFNSKSPTNAASYDNPEMDKLLVGLQGAEGPEDGAEIMAAITKLWYDEAPGFGVTAAGTFEIWSPTVHGIQPTSETMVLFDQAWKE